CGKNVLVVGLARSGVAAARWLSDHGAVVTGTDTRGPSAFPEAISELLNRKVGLELGLHRESTFLRQDLIVISPGVPADLPVLNLARQKGIPVVPQIEV
ncbi:MAG: UDP-N-acetylmuramoyl-L-alanine--D-glutamate ligase, partial [Acidobacteria bacterium]|nr:UDP-N-acetylmuramoyl-L-alanine--D-glutamate ligase [Acidobacteriota bacterium]